MPQPGPLSFSMMVTAGVRSILTAADFNVASPYWARLSNIAFVSRIELDYDAATIGPHHLILSPNKDSTASGSPTDSPLWVAQVWPTNQDPPPNRYPKLPNALEFWQPLLCGGQLDLYFTTGRWPATTYFKPSALNCSVEYTPYNRAA